MDITVTELQTTTYCNSIAIRVGPSPSTVQSKSGAPMRTITVPRSALAVLTALLLGCADQPTVTVDEPTTPEPTGPHAAVYATLTADQNDALIGASSPVADSVELHETTVENGVASMAELDEIPLPEGESVILQPGGLHLMLLEPEPLQQGDRLAITLEFAEADAMEVEVPVVATADMPDHHDDH
ncbi:copper chaperone PCu(A)C [Egibacter rhizosphaerae]|uniref:Copper chaperone PCu(A)C n=1 Tax=Egibacter rhizosphaerae TaxID=1670831 RepID=A0A411YFQ7_9ACTN|nr:copper chaperone PCu(A)C [Egibacter rhizosphaerae]QBI19942.1 copper chaperone PCu(A)C [Egibacter rhizosphaerae]